HRKGMRSIKRRRVIKKVIKKATRRATKRIIKRENTTNLTTTSNTYKLFDLKLDTHQNPNIIAWGTAIYSYTAQQEGELSFNEGDYIGILEELGDGWSRGDLNGVEGLFPTP